VLTIYINQKDFGSVCKRLWPE